jgi:hypothetical protein
MDNFYTLAPAFVIYSILLIGFSTYVFAIPIIKSWLRRP